MAKEKAVFLRKWRDQNPFSKYPAVHMEYLYRGKTYIITDEHNGYSEPMWVKHKNEQKRIDREIELESKPGKPFSYEEYGQAGFDFFYEWLENESKTQTRRE